MTKNFSKLLLCMALALTACQSSREDEPAGQPVDESGEKATVTFGLSRAEAEDFTAAGITDLTVFVYKVERKGTSLYTSRTMAVGDGKFDMEFPLGETFQSIAIANASSITDTESLETLTVHLDPMTQSDVWISPAARFSSDKSVDKVTLTLIRKVARITFTPAETAEELQQVDFDNLNLKFRNVATAYKASSGKAIGEEITIAAPASQGFSATFYTFETSGLAENGKMMIEYTKGGSVVNTSYELDCNVKYSASQRVNLVVPVTDPSIIDMGARSAKTLTGMVVAEISNL